MPEGTASDLVVAFNFPPFNDGSAVTLAKRVIEGQRPVDVIAADLSKIRSRDESLLHLVSPWVRKHDILDVPILFADERSVGPFVEQGLRTAAARRSEPYDSVYSRSMWPHSHYLAALLHTRGRARTWTAEFSDPILWHADATRRPSAPVTIGKRASEILRALGSRGQQLLLEQATILAWAQFVPFLLADTLVFTNEQQMEVMVDDAPEWLRARVIDRAEISPHPTLPREHYGPGSPPRLADGKFRVGYFGTFYPNRGGGDFVQAMRLLPHGIQDSLRLDVYSDHAASLRRVAQDLGLGRSVRALTPAPFLDFLRLSNEYDALLVNDISSSPFRVPSPFLPSKYSDYAGSDAPVMALTLPGSPLDTKPVTWKARVGDVDGIAAVLRDAVESLSPCPPADVPHARIAHRLAP